MPEADGRGPGTGKTVASERVQARVNVAAIERNCARLRSELSAGTRLCAVVKAGGYGHGAVASARAALAGGASWLAVVSARELEELREVGLSDVQILVMGALAPAELATALAAGGEVVIWTEHQLRAVASLGGGRVHVKLDSGMGRLGARDPAEATRLVELVERTDGVELVGLMTHFATADEPDDGGFFAEQLERFRRWSEGIRSARPELLVHAANSAAVLREQGAHFDMVRCGIAVYGMDPFGEDPAPRDLEPALELSSFVADVKRCAKGESTGYGRRFVAGEDTTLGLLPIGYGDGWRRNLSGEAEVLIGGRRRALVGTVSMDSVAAELGPGEQSGLLGEAAVLIGAQGSERITAEQLARRLGTINYEITCGLTARVPRIYHRDGATAEEGAIAPDARAPSLRTT
jgi:alanine racemase